MRRLAVLLAFLAGPAGAEWCPLGCDVSTSGAEAAEGLEGWLGIPVPPGTVVEHLVEGGFQDAFVQARLLVDAEGLAALLGAAGLTTADLAPTEPTPASPGDPEWWDWPSRKGVKEGHGNLPDLPYATILVAPAAGASGRWTLYLWAFQT